MLSDGLCAACEHLFGAPAARRFRSSRLQFDLAYGAYALSGLYFLLESAWMAGNGGESTGLVLLVVFVLPVIALVAAAVWFAVFVFTLVHWTHVPLSIQGLITVLFVVLGARTDLAERPAVAIPLCAAYGLVMLMLSGWWFRALRQEHFPAG
jgi:hypothetical protein